MKIAILLMTLWPNLIPHSPRPGLKTTYDDSWALDGLMARDYAFARGAMEGPRRAGTARVPSCEFRADWGHVAGAWVVVVEHSTDGDWDILSQAKGWAGADAPHAAARAIAEIAGGYREIGGGAEGCPL